MTENEREPLPGRKEVAAYIGMTEGGLAALHYRGQGPDSIIIGRSCRYFWEDVDRWLASRKKLGSNGTDAQLEVLND